MQPAIINDEQLRTYTRQHIEHRLAPFSGRLVKLDINEGQALPKRAALRIVVDTSADSPLCNRCAAPPMPQRSRDSQECLVPLASLDNAVSFWPRPGTTVPAVVERPRRVRRKRNGNTSPPSVPAPVPPPPATPPPPTVERVQTVDTLLTFAEERGRK